MAAAGFFSINNSIDWRITNTNSQSTSVSISRVAYSNSIISGTGFTSIDSAYFTTGIISVTDQPTRFDLINLTGGTSDINLSGAKVKLICINNTSVTGVPSGESSVRNLTLRGTGVGGLISPFSSGYLGTTINPSSYKIFFDLVSGYPVTTGERYFYLSGPSGTTFDIAVLGKI